jgi:hypothetical protein
VLALVFQSGNNVAYGVIKKRPRLEVTTWAGLVANAIAPWGTVPAQDSRTTGGIR